MSISLNEKRHEYRLDIPAANANLLFVAATGGQGHADAEHQAAKQIFGPYELRTPVRWKRPIRPNFAEIFQYHCTDHETAMDRNHPRMCPASPILTQPVTAPMVQKLVLSTTAPRMKAIPKANHRKADYAYAKL